jgi:prepilin signal peptidase PulO-like enzyme (type II secretory pathway)
MYWWSTEIVPGLLDVPGGRPFQPELLIGLILVSVLIVITGTDLTHGIIPNKAVAVGLMVMTPAVIGCALYRHQPGRIGMAAVASVAGGAFFLVAGLLYGAFFMRSDVEKDAQKGEQVSAEKPEPERGAGISEPAPNTDEGRHTAVAQGLEISTGVGMGDVKLMLVTGLALGYFHWYFVIVHVFLSSVIVGVAVLPLMIFLGKGRKSKIPFGPFLAAGAILTIVWGQALTDLYVRLLK